MMDSPTRTVAWRFSRFPGESMNSGFGQHFLDERDPRDQLWSHVETRARSDAAFHAMLSDRIARLDQQAPGVFRPEAVDLRPFCSPVRDQGLLNACVGFSAASLIEFLLRTQAEPRTTVCSPQFIWYFARKYEFNSGLNVGAQLRDGIRVASHVGCSPEALDPYDPVAYMPPPRDEGRGYEVEAVLNVAAAREPTREAISAARQYVLQNYYRLRTLGDYRACLSRGFSFVMSCPVYESAWREAFRQRGHIGEPPEDRVSVGGHTLLVCGYMDEREAPGGGYLICKSSQGPGLGDRGYFWLPFVYATSGEDGSSELDAWTALELGD